MKDVSFGVSLTRAQRVAIADLFPRMIDRLKLSSLRIMLVPGAEFKTALFNIWLSDKPADENLKQAMVSNRTRR